MSSHSHTQKSTNSACWVSCRTAGGDHTLLLECHEHSQAVVFRNTVDIRLKKKRKHGGH